VTMEGDRKVPLSAIRRAGRGSDARAMRGRTSHGGAVSLFGGGYRGHGSSGVSLYRRAGVEGEDPVALDLASGQQVSCPP
jgi:hypothetical protein